MGRRPSGRVRRINYLLAPIEHRHFDAAAKRAGMSLSAWMRSRCRKAAKEEAREAGDDEPIFELED